MPANRKPETIPLGSSKKRPYQLTSKHPVTGVVAAIDGTGLTPTLVISTSKTALTPPTGITLPTVAWSDQSGGEIEVDGLESFPVGNYYWRVKQENGAGEVEFWPNEDEALVWSVVIIPKHP